MTDHKPGLSLFPAGKGSAHAGPFPPTKCRKCGARFDREDVRWVFWPETKSIEATYEHICPENEYEKGIRLALESAIERAKRRRGTAFTRRKDRRWKGR